MIGDTVNLRHAKNSSDTRRPQEACYLGKPGKPRKQFLFSEYDPNCHGFGNTSISVGALVETDNHCEVTKLRCVVLCHHAGNLQAVLLLEAGQFLSVRAQQGTHRRLLPLHHLLQTRFPSAPRTRQDGLLDKTE